MSKISLNLGTPGEAAPPALPAMYDKLTAAERRWVREEYVRLQGGNCSHCKASLAEKVPRRLPIDERLFPPGFFTHPIHLHHSHASGLTLGAVHCECNAILWQYHGE